MSASQATSDFYGARKLQDPFFKGKVIHVGVAEWKIARPPDALRTTLGSCVGTVLYDPKQKAGGVAHILLAEAPHGKIVKKGKYARPAITALVAELNQAGIETTGLRARIFGGASMFTSGGTSIIQHIGEDNVKAVKDTLKEMNIPIILEETGGNAGRTISLFLDDGRVLLRANGKEKYLYKT